MYELVLRLEQASVLLAYAVLVVLGLARLWRSRATILGALPAWPVWLGVAIGATLLRLFAPPVFSHVGFHPYGLLDATLDFPSVATYRTQYGQGSFVVLGAVAWLTGGGWQSVLVANAVLGAALVVAIGLLGARLTPRLAGPLSVCLAAASPLLVRVAASEDAHTLASLLGVFALLSADQVRRDRDWRFVRLVPPIAWTYLAFTTRQTLLLHLVLVLALLWPDRGHEVLRVRRRLAVAFAVLGAALLPRLLALSAPGAYTGFNVAALVWSMRLFLLPAAWRFHPLFDPGASAAILVGLAAAAWAWRGLTGRLARVLAIGAALHFVAFFPLSFVPGVGVAYAFRAPLWTLLLPLAGAGLASLAAALGGAGGGPRRVFVTGALLVVTLLAPLSTLRATLDRVDPRTQEYEILSSHRDAIARGAVLEFAGLSGEVPTNYRVPRSLYAGSSCLVDDGSGRPLDAPHRAIYVGLHCTTYALVEMLGTDFSGMVARARSLSLGELNGLIDAVWTDPDRAIRLLGGQPRTGPRAECERAVRGAARFVPWGTVTAPESELPQTYYVEPRQVVGVWITDESVLR